MNSEDCFGGFILKNSKKVLDAFSHVYDNLSKLSPRQLKRRLKKHSNGEFANIVKNTKLLDKIR